MDILISNEILLLIEDKMGKYKFPLNECTSLEKDLGMTGDDAVEFIMEFSEKFNIDISEFKIGEYFEPEGDAILPAILGLLTGKRSQKQKELTIGDLQKAVNAHKLDNMVIGK